MIDLIRPLLTALFYQIRGDWFRFGVRSKAEAAPKVYTSKRRHFN